ncbi:MAG: polyketide synthase dehydratase domain-containing protein [Phycisphaeraceae bacterium]|nr:polyketide synthase dehydratase domain-containing protein [Phycisphaeraceae bacterium]MCW5762990.1 polyketide synthase dehydratase domain-containing protein [Phycisphaeraceae bacterium]
MHFSLIDSVLEQTSDRITAIKHVSAAEEYLQDHFPGFPVLPGVLMLEAMVQAARILARSEERLVLGKVTALKYGSFVQPGDTLVVYASLTSRHPDGSIDARVEARKVGPGMPANDPQAPRAASGRVTLRPIRMDPEGTNSQADRA